MLVLPRNAMKSRPLLSCSVRLSVRLFVTFVNSVKTSNRILRLFHFVVAKQF